MEYGGGGGLTQFGDSLNGLINIFGDDGVPCSFFEIFHLPGIII